jgi:hypothetical protein
MLYSTKEFDEHHKRKVITWVEGSYLDYPLKVRIFDGNIFGINDHNG